MVTGSGSGSSFTRVRTAECAPKSGAAVSEARSLVSFFFFFLNSHNVSSSALQQLLFM